MTRVKRRSILAALPMLCFIAASAAAAETAPGVQREVNFLLDAIDGSGCSFFRNGTWYGAHEAQAHLRDKYDWLAARDVVDATEQFIDRVATQSSLSGRPYLVQCAGGPPLPSSQWLREKLEQFRRPP